MSIRSPHKRLFIGPLADSDKWEMRLQIVRAWAVYGLATFAVRDPSLLPVVQRCLRSLARSESKALKTRARRIRERLAAEQRTRLQSERRHPCQARRMRSRSRLGAMRQM
jgi:hypothetical protein